MNVDAEILESRLRALDGLVGKLLDRVPIKFDRDCRSALPDAPGVYRIFASDMPGETVRAGRSDVTLRQRVYQNHLMGNQKGNLRAQLVRHGVCADLESAKRHIQDNLLVQAMPILDEQERIWLEHFMLAAFRPRFCD